MAAVDEPLNEQAAIPEPDKIDRTRESVAALTVGLVVLLIGVPVWWKTTEVYRCQLPYSEIDELATLTLEQTVKVEVVNCLASDKLITSSLQSQLSNALNKGDEDSLDGSVLLIKYDVIARDCLSSELTALQSATVTTVDDLNQGLYTAAAASTLPRHGNFSVYLVPSQLLLRQFSSATVELSKVKAVVTRRRHAFLSVVDKSDASDVATVIRNIVVETVVNEVAVREAHRSRNQRENNPTQHGGDSSKRRMRSLGLSPGYDVTFSLINSQPSILSPHWDIDRAAHVYLGHFLTLLKDFVKVDIRSRFLHHIGLGVIPRRDESTGSSVLSVDQLPHIINPIEAHLGSYVSNNPSINFVVYIPTREQMPLKVHDESGKPSKTNALFSPRWGGVYFYNVDANSMETKLPTNDSVLLPLHIDIDMQRIMSVFAAQLRVLLGFHSKKNSEEVVLQSSGSHIIADWELDAWLRERCVENVATTVATLTSLSQLLSKISNLVINDDIGKQVESAVRLVRETRRHLVNAELREAFLTSHAALIASEKAFFDPSLLELLYFPEDQKFAIYIPLFLPVGLPIVLSSFQAVKWLLRRYRSAQCPRVSSSSKTESCKSD